MEKQVFEKYDGEHVTENMLQEAAVLFSENYGVWGERATNKSGSRVRLSKDRLRSQYLLDNAMCFYVRVTVNGQLAGNAFACRWTVNNKSVLWVTQLVVSRDYRERGLAKGLLNQLKQNDVDIYGLMSSHPAACLAAAKSFRDSIATVQLGFISRHAEEVMKASPISYIKNSKLCGSAFDPSDTSGLVSSVDSGFFVDHNEPLEALAWVREEMKWPLGELFDGHEFLLILETRRRSRSRSTSRPPLAKS